MYAYVRFLFDKKCEVLPVTKIRDFVVPIDVTDFNGNASVPIYDVFWSGDSKTRGGYYEAEVIYLADTENDAKVGGDRKRVRKSSRPRGSTPAEKKDTGCNHPSSTKQKRTRTQRRQELDFLDEISSEDELVEKRLLDERDREIEHLERELHQLRKLNKNMQQALCTKVLNADSASSASVQGATAAANNRNSKGTSSATYISKPIIVVDSGSESMEVFGDAPVQMLKARPATENDMQFCWPNILKAEPLASVSADSASSAPVQGDSAIAANHETSAETSSATDALHSLEPAKDSCAAVMEACDVSIHHLVNGQDISKQSTSKCSPDGGDMVDLGNGVQIPKSKWTYLLQHKEESRFVKELAVVIWGTQVLAHKTFSGALSNWAKSEGKTEVYPALTPEKVQALRDAFTIYLTQEKNIAKEDLKKKSSLLRKYISEKMSDLRRYRRQ